MDPLATAGKSALPGVEMASASRPPGKPVGACPGSACQCPDDIQTFAPKSVNALYS